MTTATMKARAMRVSPYAKADRSRNGVFALGYICAIEKRRKADYAEDYKPGARGGYRAAFEAGWTAGRAERIRL